MKRFITQFLVCICGVLFVTSLYAQTIVTPSAGDTETFSPVVGSVFTDPGGIGGNCTGDGAEGNYPNCGCVTVTTLTGPNIAVDFQTMGIWGTADYLVVYDGSTTSGAILLDSRDSGGSFTMGDLPNHNRQSAGSTVLASSSNALTFEFNSTTVISRCGWEALIVAGASSGAACTITCPADLTVNADPSICAGIVSLTAPVPTGDCAPVVRLLEEGFDDCSLPAGWSVETDPTTAGGNTGIGPCGSSLFAFDCTDGSAFSTPFNPAWSGCIAAISDDDASSAFLGTGYIISSVIDISSVSGAQLTFDWAGDNISTNCTYGAEVWDGSAWVNVFLVTTLGDQTGSASIDLSSYNNSDFQIRWYHDDNSATWGWGFAFDNVVISGVDNSGTAVVTNDYTGTSGDLVNVEFPLGTTTVTFSTFDGSGNLVSCSTDVTVLDAGPSITCSPDITVTLDAGACEYYHHYQPVIEVCNPANSTSGDPFGPLQFPGDFQPHGNGVVYSLQGGSLPQGLFFDFTNNSSENYNITEFGVRFHDPVIDPPPVTAPVVFNVWTSDTWAGNQTNPAAWTAVPSQPVTVIEPYFPTGTGALSKLVLNQPVSVPPGETVGFHIFSNTGAILFNGNLGGALPPVTVGDFTLSPGEVSFAEFANIFQAGLLVQPNITISGFIGDGQSYELVEGLPSGSAFPIGTTRVCLAVEDAAGLTDTCCFNVNVEPFPNPTLDLACNDLVNVSPDIDCEVLITPDMVLEGGDYKCYDEYVVILTDANGNPVPNPVNGLYVGEILTVMVQDTATGNLCWGEIRIEDKYIPELNCSTFEWPCTSDIAPSTDPPVVGSVTVGDEPGDGFDASPQTLTYDIDVPFLGANTPIEFISLDIDISHTYMGDVEVRLTTPEGTVLNVMVAQCGANGNVIATFDEFGTPLVCGNPTSGHFTPQTPFTNAYGENGAGTWTLTIFDNFPGIDAGTVNSYALTVNALTSSSLPLPIADSLARTQIGENAFVVEGFDPCGDVTLTYEDESYDLDCTTSDYTGLVLRTWTVTDGAVGPKGANSYTCVDSIWLTSPSVNEIELPIDRDNIDAPALECYGGWDLGCDGRPNTGDAGEGDGIPQPCEIGDDYSGAICDIWTGYTDRIIDVCAGTRKIFRDWVILDKCTGELLEHTQVIIIEDSTPPVVDCPVSIGVPSDPFDCSGRWLVQPPSAYDECSSVTGWDLSVSAGEVIVIENYIGGVLVRDTFVIGLPAGCTPAVFTIYDECGNAAICETELCVVDDQAPVAKCDQHTQVSLGSNGYARAHWSIFDDGSEDNCGILAIQVRRTSPSACYDGYPYSDSRPSDATAWSDSVYFCCDDIALSPIEVEMRVIDYSGNINTCWVYVTVEDKLPPVIVLPPDIVVSCDFKFDLNDLGSAFGRVVTPDDVDGRQDIWIDDEVFQTECLGGSYQGPIKVGQDGYALDNCHVQVVENVVANLTCGQGTIERYFVAIDDFGNSTSPLLKQTIVIVDCDPFEIVDTRCFDVNKSRPGVWTSTDDVEWPCDVVVEGCSGAGTDPSATGRPVYTDDKCSIVADTFYDEVFTVVDSACLKILRHWSIIDWCQTDAQNLPRRWDYTQVIKVNDNTPPVVTPGDPPCDSTATSCYGAMDLRPNVEDVCTPVEHLAYWWKLDLYNDGVGSLPGGYDYEGTTNDPGEVISEFPQGTHRILWVIEDLCGNRSTTEYTFETVDCKKPSPVCINGLSSVVMPSSGEITIWAVDFNASSFDNCTEAEDLEYRIWYSYMDSADYPAPSPIPGHSWTRPTPSTLGEDVLIDLPTGAVFYCPALGNGVSRTFTVEVYVIDEAGNWDYCTTTIVIDDNDDVCPDSGVPFTTIGGSYTDEYGEIVDNVEVTLAEMSSNTSRTQLVSDVDGSYSFYVVEGDDYNVSGTKADHYLNGVTSNDLSVLRRHLVEIQQLNSNYKKVAADVNGDRKLDAGDIVVLRKLMLGYIDELPNQPSWVTIDADYGFAGITERTLPVDVYDQNMITYHNIDEPQMETDFIAVKMGDLDGDAEPNSLVRGSERSTGKMMLEVMNQRYASGDYVEVEVRAENFKEMTAYQFTLGFDQSVLSYAGVEGGALQVNEDYFGDHSAQRGMVTTVWYADQAQSVGSDEVLFTLKFEAKGAGELSRTLSVGSAITEAIGFSATEGRMEVGIQFTEANGEVSGEAFALYQNTPNPFDEVTTIGYVLPESSEVRFSIYDVNGRSLMNRTIEGSKGLNSIELKQGEIQAKGVLYYQIETEDYSATKRMVIVE